jgi:sigma-B regulation protein RsbQ
MLLPNDVMARNNVKVIGNGPKTLMLAHGFGCDQNMWRFITPVLQQQFKIVLFDYVGSGSSDLSQFNKERYSGLEGYAKDIVEIGEALQLSDVIFIGHSVSSIIGALASIEAPSIFSKMIMICPSPCFLNFPPDYLGGFEKQDLQELLNLMDKNYIGWANYLAPLVMGDNNPSELTGELSSSFCSTDPVVAKSFAKATFLSDYRHILKEVKQPTLIFQSKNDSLASPEIGKFINDNITNSELEIVDADGHCLHMTHPEQVTNSILKYLDK